MAKHKDPATETPHRQHLHQVVYETLLGEIKGGTYGPGDKLPSEAALCGRFATSRITIAKALQNLQLDEVVVRRAGSGTFVSNMPVQKAGLRFGLLIPDLGFTEIFEPISKGLMRSPAGESHTLIWGNASPSEKGRIHDAERLCRQFIQQKVDGVFFAPLEYVEEDVDVNQRLVSWLQAENIPVVMLDRTFEPYPAESTIDLVGIDNYRAGFVLTEHLIQRGAKRIVFAARRRSASTIVERIAGYEAALRKNEIANQGSIFLGDVEDQALIGELLNADNPDGFVCGNDITAAKLMRTLLALRKRIPEDIRIVGIDDVTYSQYLPVALTTIHQNCDEIGHMAMLLMLDRLRSPKKHATEVRVGYQLIIRESSGA